MESLIHENFRNGIDRPFKKGDLVRWKYNDRMYYYGIIDNIYERHCEVSYGTQRTLKKFLRRECNLDYFCDVDTSELQNITIEEVGNFKS